MNPYPATDKDEIVVPGEMLVQEVKRFPISDMQTMNISSVAHDIGGSKTCSAISPFLSLLSFVSISSCKKWYV
jgi:hypothetical protein